MYPTPSEEWGRGSRETQQSGNTPRSGPEIKLRSRDKGQSRGERDSKGDDYFLQLAILCVQGSE